MISDGMLLFLICLAAFIAQFVGMVYLVRTRSAVRNGWTIWHVLGGETLAMLALLVTWDSWTDIANVALTDPEASHIFLVPFIFSWLVWVRRERLRQVIPQGTSIGPILVLIGWVLMSYGYNPAGSIFTPIVTPLMWALFSVLRALLWLLTLGRVSVDFYSYLDRSVQTFVHGGTVLILVGAVLTFAGQGLLRRFMPAFVVLVFLIPSPQFVRQSIAIPLEGLQAWMTQQVLDIVGVKVDRTGNLMYINLVPVAVAEACNGLRMVFTLVLVCFAFAFGTPLRGYVRAIIIIASPVAALLCNIIRMVPTVWLYGHSKGTWFGYFSGKDVADGFHTGAGWVMLIIAFLLLMGIIRLLRWAMIPVTRYTLAYD